MEEKVAVSETAIYKLEKFISSGEPLGKTFVLKISRLGL